MRDLSIALRLNLYFFKNGSEYLSIDSTQSKTFKTYFEKEGSYEVYVRGLVNDKWITTDVINVLVFDPCLKCDKNVVSISEEITFEYSGLSACDQVYIVFEKNGKEYFKADSTNSRTYKNYFEKPTRRVDLEFSIAGNDPSMVRAILLDVCDAQEKVLKDPAPFARVVDYGAGNGVRMTLRAWCKTADYWDVYFDLLDAAQKAFEAKGIVVPFNQLDVHMK